MSAKDYLNIDADVMIEDDDTSLENLIQETLGETQMSEDDDDEDSCLVEKLEKVSSKDAIKHLNIIKQYAMQQGDTNMLDLAYKLTDCIQKVAANNHTKQSVLTKYFKEI